MGPIWRWDMLRWFGLPLRLVLVLVFIFPIAIVTGTLSLLFPRDVGMLQAIEQGYVRMWDFVWLGGE